MPRVTEEHKQAQRERIQQAALRAFQAKGFSGASMADVIAESGLSAGAIYAYYKSKDDLIASAATAIVSDRLATYERLITEWPLRHPAEFARALIEHMPSEVTERGLLLEIWGAVQREPALAALAQQQISRIDTMVGRYLTAYLTEHGRAPELAERQARALAPVLVGVVQGYAVRTAVDGPAGSEAYLVALDALAGMQITGRPGGLG